MEKIMENQNLTHVNVTVTLNELDYLGNVIEKNITRQVACNIDPVDFMSYSIEYGTHVGYKSLFPHTYYSDILKIYFSDILDFNEHNNLCRPYKIETEPIFNSAKFIVKKKYLKNNWPFTETMVWEDL